jgi:nitroreductase
MKRRRFLGFAGAGALAGLAPLAGCTPLSRANVPAPEPRTRVPGLDRRETAILRLASLAPSGHNTQPWMVSRDVSGDLLIWQDTERRLPRVDPENRELILSLGAFLENLAAGAEALGSRATIRITAADPGEVEVARVGLDPVTGFFTPDNRLLERIRSRRTLRNGHQDVELSSAQADALLSLLPHGSLYLPRGTVDARAVTEATIEANRIHTSDHAVMRELVEWVRFSPESARANLDGLTPASMGFSALTAFFARNFMQPADLLSPSNRKHALEAAREQAESGGGWLIVPAPEPGSGPAGLIATGRAFERAFLAARELGVAVHPMSQAVEIEAVRRALAASLGTDEPAFCLRVGRIQRYPDPVSLRRPVAWFVS